MAILPDYLQTGLRVVFCGTAVAKVSAARRHYYAGPGNDFWRYLFEAGFTKARLYPDDDDKICSFGCGLTDLAKGVSASSDYGLKPHYDVAAFIAKMEEMKPGWIAFHGKEAAKTVARHLGKPTGIMLGRQVWNVGDSSVFVVPSASGANRDSSRLEGKSDRLDWFKELAGLATKNGQGNT